MLGRTEQPTHEAADPELAEKERYLRSLFTPFPFPDSFVRRLPKDWQDWIATYPNSLTRLPGTENRAGIPLTLKFLRNLFEVRVKDWSFVEDTMKIDPEDRPTTYELLDHA